MSQMLYRVAKRWIAGQDADEALQIARSLNARGQGVMLNYLGEDILDQGVISAHNEEYTRLQESINTMKLDASISVKLTQLGLGLDADLARKNLLGLAEKASGFRQFLWVDMEGSKYTERTLELYHELLGSFRGVGVAIQAYLRRSEKDVEAILEKGGKIRLCKGAYRETPDIVYTGRPEITQNYVTIMKRVFQSGGRVGIATHDSYLISTAKDLAKDTKSEFEFQMLKGIRDELKDKLVSDGYRMVTYLPYGTSWYSYSKRRIMEHPSNIWLILRSLL
ncbi:MAG: proline dehydrogenase family protein [Nitrososphaerota archaeon]|jgi:proline dehydrogenase|nr:proline dehydrogenase family protein [Nitrososphaerota archaeon]